jgi:hypothetical protein
MKHLLSGVAVATALMVALPVWAQNPSGGNPVGTPGPNPGGPGLTPYTGGVPPSPPMGPKPSGSNYIPPPATTAPPPEATAPPSSTSATVPTHHAVRHARAMHAHHKYMAAKAALSGDTTAQLNREELARIQSGNLNNPPAPSGPPPGAESGPPPAPMPGGPMPGPTPPGPMPGH